MPRNPFSQPNPQEQLRGDSISRLNRRKILRLRDEHGGFQDIVAEGRISMPDGQGGIVVDEYVNYQADSAGNPIPQDLHQLHISHSGLLHPFRKRAGDLFLQIPPTWSFKKYLCRPGRKKD